MIDETRLGHFRDILNVVRWEFPGSHPVIGGGALRDSYHDRPIKDVDVFLRAQDHETLDSELTKYIRPPIIVQHGYGRADMHGAWDFLQEIHGYQVQLILADFNDLYDLAHTFDIGLARATFDGDTLYLSDEFKQDSADKVLRIRRADNEFELERSLKRIARLSQKYPDFTTSAQAA
ncbi:nucleotidyltransferase [Ralstonia phage BOESR1]|uniref:Nucleotidyltransferase n=1 Tax=Ralstonia phage BOESR1 TaxID=3034917 RepID=A0AA50F2U6_9CAUD|nr:nucleotidyltransferase [Ralstonia phage BOESR1]WLW40592.1 nucleotidyltransferase [Ralstonia phage BOESR1]